MLPAAAEESKQTDKQRRISGDASRHPVPTKPPDSTVPPEHAPSKPPPAPGPLPSWCYGQCTLPSVYYHVLEAATRSSVLVCNNQCRK